MSRAPILAAVALVLGAACAGPAAEERCILEGVGVLTIDSARWTFATTGADKTRIHTVSARDGSKRIIWVYRPTGDANFEQAVIDLEDLVRGRGDLTIVDAPKLPVADANGQRPTGLYLVTGLLADYDALRVAKVAIDVDTRRYMKSAGYIRISNVSDPLKDPELLALVKQIEDYANGLKR